MQKELPTTDQNLSRVARLLAEVRKTPPVIRGNLIFALDATASRQPTWDIAGQLTAAMFKEIALLGSLDMQLVYFRGPRDLGGECKASRWVSNPADLAALMTKIQCMGGLTQIERVLTAAVHETMSRKINALVFVGDCCEEPLDRLVTPAARLGALNVPAFMFQEGHDPEAELHFRKIAERTHGAYHRFDQGSARQLGELLRAVASFAVGGIAALEKQGSEASRLLLRQIR